MAQQAAELACMHSQGRVLPPPTPTPWGSLKATGPAGLHKAWQDWIAMETWSAAGKLTRLDLRNQLAAGCSGSPCSELGWARLWGEAAKCRSQSRA